MSDWLSTSHPPLIHSVVQNHIGPNCVVLRSMMPRL